MANYNESRIYKIWCNLQGVDEIYIGSSARFIERCKLHESDCNNINSPRYSYKLYNYIRNNGGWNNFTVEVLEKYPCNNRKELNIREEWWKQQQQPTLNERRAHITDEELKVYQQHYERKVKQCDKCGKTYKHITNHRRTKYCKNFNATTSESTTESFIESDTDVE